MTRLSKAKIIERVNKIRNNGRVVFQKYSYIKNIEKADTDKLNDQIEENKDKQITYFIVQAIRASEVNADVETASGQSSNFSDGEPEDTVLSAADKKEEYDEHQTYSGKLLHWRLLVCWETPDASLSDAEKLEKVYSFPAYAFDPVRVNPANGRSDIFIELKKRATSRALMHYLLLKT